jgi:hypothetical protein
VSGDNVRIDVHKELELTGMENHFSARHSVMIDDKLRILDEIKRIWRDRVTGPGHDRVPAAGPRRDGSHAWRHSRRPTSP